MKFTNFTNIKRIRVNLCVLFLLVLVLCFQASFAAAQSQEEVKVFLDQKELALSVNPQFFDGVLTVPVRSFSEALGAKVNWDKETNSTTINKNGGTLVLKLEQIYTEENGKLVKVDAPIFSSKGTTMISLSFLAEFWGLDLQQDDKQRVVRLESLAHVPLERFSDKEKDAWPVWQKQWVDSTAQQADIQYRLRDNKLYLLSTYGKKATGGYDVRITKVMRRGSDNAFIVYVEYKDASSLPTIQILTMPYDLVYINIKDPSGTPSALVFKVKGYNEDKSLPGLIKIPKG